VPDIALDELALPEPPAAADVVLVEDEDEEHPDTASVVRAAMAIAVQRTVAPR